MFIGPWPELVLAVGLLAVVGAANSVEDVAGFTLLQRLVPDQFLTACSESPGASRWAASRWARSRPPPGRGARATDGLRGRRPGPAALGARHRRLAETDHAVAPAPELELVEQVPMFGPLSVAAKGELRRTSFRCLPSGDVVIRAGEVGDRFYIVGQGELEVSAEGVEKRISHADYFGEIALLGMSRGRRRSRRWSTAAVRPPARGLPRGSDGT